MTNQLFIHPGLRQEPKLQAANTRSELPAVAPNAVLLEPVFKTHHCSVCEDTAVVTTWKLDHEGCFSPGSCWACQGAPVIDEPITIPRATRSPADALTRPVE